MKRDLKEQIDFWTATRKFTERREVTVKELSVIPGEYQLVLLVTEDINVHGLKDQVIVEKILYTLAQTSPVDPSNGDAYRFTVSFEQLDDEYNKARELKIQHLIDKLLG